MKKTVYLNDFSKGGVHPEIPEGSVVDFNVVGNYFHVNPDDASRIIYQMAKLLTIPQIAICLDKANGGFKILGFEEVFGQGVEGVVQR